MKLAAVAALLEGEREWAGRERMEVMVLGTSLAESLASWLAFDSTWDESIQILVILTIFAN